MRGIAGCDTGWQPKKSAETNGIIVNFFKMSETSSRTNVSVEEDDLFDEIIFTEMI